MARAPRKDGWERANSVGAIGHWRLSRMLERSDISGRDAVSVRHRVPAFSFSREWVEEQEEGRRRKQEKGTVSRQVPRVCLPIVFLGDMALRSDERRVGKESVTTCKLRWALYQ